MIGLKNILMATDFTRFSIGGQTLSRDLCRRFGATLHLLHVVDDRPHGPLEAVGKMTESHKQATIRQAAQEEETVVRLWEELFPDCKNDHPVKFAVRFGDPVSEILSYSEDNGVDLIVAGTHGRTGLDRILAGSIAEKLVRLAPCPVLTVHPSPSPESFDIDVRVRIVRGPTGEKSSVAS